MSKVNDYSGSLKNVGELFVLRGTITRFQVCEKKGKFFSGGNNSSEIHFVSGAIYATGDSNMSFSLSNVADIESAPETIDLVEFEIDGRKIFGKIWLSPFSDGDRVEAVVRKVDEGYEAFAIIRPSDRIIALPVGPNVHQCAASIP